MKKSLVLIVVLIVFSIMLVGCQDKVTIDECKWQLQVATKANLESLESQTLACDKGWVDGQNAPIIDAQLVANDDTLTIIDKTNNKTYVGTYTHSNTVKTDMVYNITLGPLSGRCVTSYTYHENGYKVATLVITLIDNNIQYMLQFQRVK